MDTNTINTVKTKTQYQFSILSIGIATCLITVTERAGPDDFVRAADCRCRAIFAIRTLPVEARPVFIVTKD